MNELSLFTGAGGGLLGTKLLGWTCIGAVEIEEYPCRTIRQRQKDGIMEDFPIWHMDIRAFNERIAEMYKGVVDVITAGFPCQPFSVAGKGRGDKDERNMWPATMECIRLVEPRFVMLENVPRLLAFGYVQQIFGALAEVGYYIPWDCISAFDVGANHKRERLWFVADSRYNVRTEIQVTGENGQNSREPQKGTENRGKLKGSGGSKRRVENMADTDSLGTQRDKSGDGKGCGIKQDSEDVPDTKAKRIQGKWAQGK